MDKNEIIKILEDWNFWRKDIETGITRDFYLQRLKKFLLSEQVIVITGARRSGKSFIMRQLAKELINSGKHKEQILFVNLEDPRFAVLDSKSLQKIYETYLEFIHPEGKHYVFLDEVQEVEKWEKWVLTMRELKKAQVILSGSNAKLLSRELSTLLTGRHLNLEVLPLSFREFLQFNGVSGALNLHVLEHEIKIKRLLKIYLEQGGFPEVALKEQKKELLLTYFEDVLEKDLIKRYKVRKTERFKELLKFYFSNISSQITFSSLEKFLKISADTIEKFSSYFETNYLLFFVKKFSFKVKEQEKSPRKVYAIDTGLANTIGFRFSENKGKLMENIVFLELQRRKLQKPSLEIYYWKDEKHREVDIVVKEENSLKKLMQVCWDVSDFQTHKREIDSLLRASEQLKCHDLLVITWDEEKEENIKGKKIRFVPLWKWLLANK